ncbi:hypothetical protein AB6A40_011461 [Gnathostoma spinigerum]|uniref:Uncharacterized protein n=1 Tax=Gnathostoma spinigerum TaxID=75299 RepID=A0ABD6F437_9BILA
MWYGSTTLLRSKRVPSIEIFFVCRLIRIRFPPSHHAVGCPLISFFPGRLFSFSVSYSGSSSPPSSILYGQMFGLQNSFLSVVIFLHYPVSLDFGGQLWLGSYSLS